MLTSSCLDKVTGIPLLSLTMEGAIRHICNEWAIKKTALEKYKCNKCPYWHVIQEDVTKIHDENKHECEYCHSNRANKFKRTYQNSIQAKKIADDYIKSTGNLLRPYPCPYGNGWHLTSEKQKYPGYYKIGNLENKTTKDYFQSKYDKFNIEQLDTKLNEVKSSKSKLAPPIVKKLDKKIITDDKVLEEKDICKCPSCFFSDSKFAFTKSMIGENWIKCPNCKMQFN